MTRIPLPIPNSDNSPRVPAERRRVRRRPNWAASAALLVAQNYASVGLPVIPLAPGGKRPATPHGKDDATTDAGQIRQWWTQWTTANIGVRPPCGLVVLDVDLRYDGRSNLRALVRPHGSLPATWTATTGGGGQHLWFRAVGPFRGELCRGVDIKANTGYLVVPPSVHPNGQPYAWANLLPVVAAPKWLLRMLYQPVKLSSHLKFPANSITDRGLVQSVATAPSGNRNRVLYWAACRSAERGASPELLDQIAKAASTAGLAGEEIDRTIRSALRSVAA